MFVDDHKVMRQGLINLVGTQPGIDVVGEASNGREAINQILQLKPDVVIMDISMPPVFFPPCRPEHKTLKRQQILPLSTPAKPADRMLR